MLCLSTKCFNFYGWEIYSIKIPNFGFSRKSRVSGNSMETINWSLNWNVTVSLPLSPPLPIVSSMLKPSISPAVCLFVCFTYNRVERKANHLLYPWYLDSLFIYTTCRCLSLQSLVWTKVGRAPLGSTHAFKFLNITWCSGCLLSQFGGIIY